MYYGPLEACNDCVVGLYVVHVVCGVVVSGLILY